MTDQPTDLSPAGRARLRELRVQAEGAAVEERTSVEPGGCATGCAICDYRRMAVNALPGLLDIADKVDRLEKENERLRAAAIVLDNGRARCVFCGDVGYWEESDNRHHRSTCVLAVLDREVAEAAEELHHTDLETATKTIREQERTIRAGVTDLAFNYREPEWIKLARERMKKGGA